MKFRTARLGGLFLALVISMVPIWGQEDYRNEIENLKAQREQVTEQEREALKKEVEIINSRLERGTITAEYASELKQQAADKRARNIEDRQAIIDSRIALLERNEGKVLEGDPDQDIWEEGISVGEGDQSWEPWEYWNKHEKYDRRTYSNLVLGFGLNNAIPEGGSLNDSPYSAWRSRYFEIGLTWRTRVFNNSNFMRVHYGFSFTFNGLRNSDNLYFTLDDNGEVVRELFPVSLDKSKFRTDNLIIPLHFEFGPSRKSQSDSRLRYSINNQFRIGVGGFAGVNLGTRQKLKYSMDGQRIKEKSKGLFDPNQFVYGLSGWIGVGCVQFQIRYDLQTILKNTEIEENNISFGLRFEI